MQAHTMLSPHPISEEAVVQSNLLTPSTSAASLQTTEGLYHHPLPCQLVL